MGDLGPWCPAAFRSSSLLLALEYILLIPLSKKKSKKKEVKMTSLGTKGEESYERAKKRTHVS